MIFLLLFATLGTNMQSLGHVSRGKAKKLAQASRQHFFRQINEWTIHTVSGPLCTVCEDHELSETAFRECTSYGRNESKAFPLGGVILGNSFFKDLLLKGHGCAEKMLAICFFDLVHLSNSIYPTKNAYNSRMHHKLCRQ